MLLVIDSRWWAADCPGNRILYLGVGGRLSSYMGAFGITTKVALSHIYRKPGEIIGFESLRQIRFGTGRTYWISKP